MKEACFLYESEIDSVLSRIGGVEPRSGFEDRLIFHLALSQPDSQPLWMQVRNRLFPAENGWRGPRHARTQVVFAVLAAGLACIAILMTGAIHRIPATPVVIAPVQQRSAPGGFGAAAAGLTPAEKVHAAHPSARGHGHPRQGRALLPTAPSHVVRGVATPRSPYSKDVHVDANPE